MGAVMDTNDVEIDHHNMAQTELEPDLVETHKRVDEVNLVQEWVVDIPYDSWAGDVVLDNGVTQVGALVDGKNVPS